MKMSQKLHECILKFVVCNLIFDCDITSSRLAESRAQKIMMMETMSPYNPMASAKMRMRIIPTKMASVWA